MEILLFGLMVLAMGLVVGSLAMGLVAMARGGTFNQRYGNTLMQSRVLTQALALLLLAGLVLLAGAG